MHWRMHYWLPWLRRALQLHIASGVEPHLSESEKPIGSWDWDTGLATDGVECVDIDGEGPDLEAQDGDLIENLDDEL